MTAEATRGQPTASRAASEEPGAEVESDDEVLMAFALGALNDPEALGERAKTRLRSRLATETRIETIERIDGPTLLRGLQRYLTYAPSLIERFGSAGAANILTGTILGWAAAGAPDDPKIAQE